MPPATETTDHDAGPPPLYMPAAGFVVPILLDRHCWALAATWRPDSGTAARHRARGGVMQAPITSNEKPAAVLMRDGLELVFTPLNLGENSDDYFLHPHAARV